MMFDTIVQCCYPLKDEIGDITKNKQKLDIKTLVACYTTDIIGSCAFGLDCNSFKSECTDFQKFGRAIFAGSLFDQIILLICFTQPWIGHLFNIRVLPKLATDFFFKVVKDTVQYRKENNVKRNDALQILIDIEDEIDGSHLTIEETAAQCLVFFIAGFESSSSTITFCLYELAKNSDIQQKVRDEIINVLAKHDGKITYEFISDLKYMTQTIEETLRKYPPLPQLPRKCVKDYRVPNTDVVIEKGTAVFIPVLGLHYDSEYYPNPDRFDPDRFSEENKAARHQFTYLPFGEGPRICLGVRFGMIQMKVCLTVLLKSYIFSLNNETPTTLTLDPKNYLLSTVETIYLDSIAIN